MTGADYHVPVLCREVTSLFAVNKSGVYVDGTLGGGGHFSVIAKTLAQDGVLVGIDRDGEALENIRRRKIDTKAARIIVERAKFSEFDSVLSAHNISKADGLFVDLGVSSRQIDARERGFMYMHDAPLDMRMDQKSGITAAQFLVQSSEEYLASVLEDFGEIRNAERMAAAIKKFMETRRIDTSGDLKYCIECEYGSNVKIQVFAKLFQALRIAVNGELDELRLFLDKAATWLTEGGRVAVISYHSLEDRMVKEFFRKAEESCVCLPGQVVCTCNKKVTFRRVNRKAIVASDEEIKNNPRARSARLRVAQKV